MSRLTLVFDVVLLLTLVGLAGQAVFSRDLFRGIVLFMVFGLLMAVCWARLQAPDVALAEAALGAGLTGALFLSTLGEIRRRRQEVHDDEP